jgi:hypothetical protein
MVAFYNQGDKAIYDAGQYFIPQERYRLNYTSPNVIEDEQEISMGIPYTNSFTNFSNRDNKNFNTGNLQPYKAQPSGSFVTNRTDYGSSGYLPGTEPEETYMDKIGGLIKTGIGMAIPGGNFLMGIGDKLNRFDNLSAQDQAFIEMQKGIDERSVHNIGNLPNQDRYGYNKVSMFGNYANLVSKLAAKAKAKPEEERTDFDNYYLEKQKEEEDIKNQIDFNNFIRQRTAANKIREAEKLGIKLTPDGTDIHGTPLSTQVQQMAAANQAAGTGGYQYGTQGGGGGAGKDFMGGSGKAEDMGSFRRGGIVSL